MAFKRPMAARSKAAENGPSGRGRVPDPKPPEPAGGWYAALQIESIFSLPRSEDDMSALGAAQKMMQESALPADKKKLVERYIALSKKESGGRFSVVQAEAVVNDYASGDISEENFAFEMRLMEAWCGGKIERFIRAESGSLSNNGYPETDALMKLAGLVQETADERPILAVVAASALRVYYPPQAEDERAQKIAEATHLLESVIVA